jgi:hypothetical protein
MAHSTLIANCANFLGHYLMSRACRDNWVVFGVLQVLPPKPTTEDVQTTSGSSSSRTTLLSEASLSTYNRWRHTRGNKQ